MECFKAKHVGMDDEILDDMLDVYADTRRLITFGKPMTALTANAYYRTLETLRKRDNCPEQ